MVSIKFSDTTTYQHHVTTLEVRPDEECLTFIGEFQGDSQTYIVVCLDYEHLDQLIDFLQKAKERKGV